MSRSDKNYSLEFPGHEWARSFLTGEETPISDILIGQTFPFPQYRVRRPATGKYYLLEYVVSGRGFMRRRGDDVPVGAGDVMFFGKDGDQDFRADETEPFHKIFVSFASGYLDSMIQAYGIRTGVYSLAEGETFADILQIAQSDAGFKEDYFRFAADLHRVLTSLAGESAKRNASGGELKNELSLWIYKKVQLSDVAERLGMSESNFIRKFRAQYGETPYRFLLREKLKVAKSLLKTTKMTVKEIAYLLRFSDEHYFSFYFKKEFGISPTSYRAK